MNVVIMVMITIFDWNEKEIFVQKALSVTSSPEEFQWFMPPIKVGNMSTMVGIVSFNPLSVTP